MVEVREGAPDGHFPAVMEVEQRAPQHAELTALGAAAHRDPHRKQREIDRSQIDKVRRFPHGLRR